MREHFFFDYAIVRVVPRVERGEFINAGVILFSSTAAYLQSRIALDTARLYALSPDTDAAVVQSYLDLMPRICAGGADAGPIGALPQRARFHWLVAPRSTIIQTSPMHTGVAADLDDALVRLFDKFVK